MRYGTVLRFVALAVVLQLPLAPCFGQQAEKGVRKTTTNAPDRNGDGVIDAWDTTCPPQTASGVKAPANNARDANKGGDAQTDYFMGEYKFVQGTKDLIVTVWCIAGSAATPPFNDYFTYEVQTSENGTNTAAVAPNNIAVSPAYPDGVPRSGFA